MSKRKYDADLMVIGLGPAGMAVSIMGSEMGLRVCAVEKAHIGGECMNVGCIPSKALLRMASARHAFTRLEEMGLNDAPIPGPRDVFERIRKSLKYISENKTSAMFKKTDLVLGKGAASFIDPHTVEVDGRHISAKRIYICAGTKPAIPPVPGIGDIDVLTNENLFDLDAVPESMVILGGGAIGCEMAQGFSRLGCRCSIVHMDEHLVPTGDEAAGEAVERAFEREGIQVLNGRRIKRVERGGPGVVVITEQGERLEGERLLVAAGRKVETDTLGLDRVGVRCGPRGIEVNRHLRTHARHIYAAGDCNGHALLSHAAMHQGMLALMNSLLPGPFRMDFRRYAVPWTVFTEPQVSQVGRTGEALRAAGVRHEEVTARYADYGAAIAEGIPEGHVRAWVTPAGRILGAQVIGEGSGEMINEWALAVQKRIRMHDIMLLQHSFPTMSFLSKRVSENWMMNRMKSPFLRGMLRRMW